MNADRAAELLYGAECPRCGRAKKALQAFCKDCYFRLPKPLRNGLYKRLGAGYTQAFNRALDYLRGAPHAA